jgi:hypothetical protein
MTIFKKITYHAFALILLTTTLIVIGMDKPQNYPQLQLSEESKKNIPLKGYLQLKNPIAIYGHLAPLQDPWAIMKLIDENGHKANLPLPVKILFNLADKSTLQFTDGITYVTAVCEKNPKISDKSFKKQINDMMKRFYTIPLVTPDYAQKCIDGGIIIKEGDTPYLSSEQEVIIVPIYSHGPNGCFNEKQLINSIIAPKIKPHNKSMHQYVMNQQTGNRPQRRLNKPNPDLIFDNCLREMESEELQLFEAQNKSLYICHKNNLKQHPSIHQNAYKLI